MEVSPLDWPIGEPEMHCLDGCGKAEFTVGNATPGLVVLRAL